VDVCSFLARAQRMSHLLQCQFDRHRPCPKLCASGETVALVPIAALMLGVAAVLAVFRESPLSRVAVNLLLAHVPVQAVVVVLVHILDR